MEEKVKKQLQEALDVLGMKANASYAMIKSRARRLKGKFHDSNESKDEEKVKAIEAAEAVLINNIGMLSELIESPQDRPYGMPKKDDNNKKEKSRINYKIVGIIVVLILATTAIITSIIITQNKREEMYLELTTMMERVTETRVDDIENHLSALPESYKDVSEIKTEFNQIMTNIDVLSASEIRIDTDEKRTAYYQLESFDDTHDEWDLSVYLERVGNGKLIELLGIRWENETYYFYISSNSAYEPDEYGSLELSTNLPNQNEDGVEYYFAQYEKFTSFGYLNQDDQYDYHIAYRIISLSQEEMILYVYETLEQVTLYPDPSDEDN